MKISVDTREDSPEEIKKVIKMLQHLVGESSYSNQSNIFSDDAPNNNIFSDNDAPNNNLSDEDSPSSQPTNAFSAMFGDNAPSPEITEETNSTDDGESEEKKLDMDSEIIPY